MQGDCGHTWAWLYFVSYAVICSFVMLNLFVAVVLEKYSQDIEEEMMVSERDVEQFFRLWQHWDPKATGFIKVCTVMVCCSMMQPGILQ